MRLFMFWWPKQPTSGSPRSSAGSDGSIGPGGVRDPPERAAVAGLADAALDVGRVDDQAAREVEHGAGQREALGLGLPDQRQEVVEHAEREQAPGDAVVALHRLHVAAPVPAADRDPGDQVVQHELVQDDDAGPLVAARRRSSRARRGRCRRGRGRRRRGAGACPAARRRPPRVARAAPAGAAPSSRRSPTATAAAASSRRRLTRAVRRCRRPR